MVEVDRCAVRGQTARMNPRLFERASTFARVLAVMAFGVGCGGTTAPSGADAGGSGGAAGAGGSGGVAGGGGSGGVIEAGSDAPLDADRECATGDACGDGATCAFPIVDGCGALGRCVAVLPVGCNAFSPGCACDGSTINVVCTGLPSGYVSAPLAHAGECADAGAVTFACGLTLQCTRASEYCKVAIGGAAGSVPSYSCEALPAACATDRTCACVQAAVGAQLCSEPSGGVTVTFQYP